MCNMITYPNLYHLKYFADAVALGSISGAAQKNLVSHPAISRAISALEKHLNIALLEHRKKSFKVTQAGYRVAEQTQILLLAASDFGNFKLKPPNEEAITLKVGISKTLSNFYLSPLLRNLKQKFPSSTAQVRFGTTNDIIEAVASGSIDLGFTIGSQKFSTLRQTIIKQGKFLLVQKDDSDSATKQIFEAGSFIITEPRSETEKLRTGYKKQFGRELPVLFEVGSWEIIGQLVQEGLGIGLLPDISITTWKKDSYKILRAPWFESPYEIYVHSTKPKSNNQVLEYARNLFMK